jgi:hypothetical protein
MSYASAGVVAPANATDNSFVFFKATFDHIFGVFNSFETANNAALATTNSNVAGNTSSIGTINTLLGTRTAAASANSMMMRDANAATALGGLSVVSTQPGAATVVLRPISGQTFPLVTVQNAAGTVNTAYIGFDGSFTSTPGFVGDLAGNATGVKGIAAHALLVGAGAGAMAALPPGSAGYVLTSQGAALDPVWSAPTGGSGGGGTASTITTGGTGDASLIDITTPLVQNVVNALSVTGGTSLQIAASSSTKLGLSVGGRWRTNTANATTNAVSGGAGNRYLVADISGAVVGGNGIAFSLNTTATLTNQYQLLICAVRWDGTTLQLDASTTDFTNLVPTINSTGFLPAVLAQDYTAGALTNAGFQNLANGITTTLHFPTALRGLIVFSFDLAQGAAAQNGYLYLSVDGGLVGKNVQFNGVPINQTLTLTGQLRVSLGAGAHTFVVQAFCGTVGPTVGAVSVNGFFYR